jgi:hypothetical protein
LSFIAAALLAYTTSLPVGIPAACVRYSSCAAWLLPCMFLFSFCLPELSADGVSAHLQML